MKEKTVDFLYEIIDGFFFRISNVDDRQYVYETYDYEKKQGILIGC